MSHSKIRKKKKRILFWQNWDVNQANNSFYLNWRHGLTSLDSTQWIYLIALSELVLV